MQIKMITASGEEHGLINTLSNHVPDDGFKNINPKIKTQLEKKKKDDAKRVTARLICRRANERLTKPYCRYAGDPIEIWHLIPGHSYELPMGFIDEVNGVQVTKRSGLMTQDGQDVRPDGAPLSQDIQGERLFELVPISF